MLFKLLTTYTKMISIPNKVPRKKRVFLGPLSRKILKLSNWEITGEFPNYKKIILIGVPHTANRDAWYALLAVLALDLKINFFGARWIFTRLPSPYTFSKDVDVESAIESLEAFEGVEYWKETYPTPLDAQGNKNILVSRMRSGLTSNKILNFWAVGDNLLKGAALNAVQIANHLYKNDFYTK